MNLSPEDAEKFLVAAQMLAKNKVDTIAFANRADGITNGNSPRKSLAISKLLGRSLPQSDSDARAKALADAVARAEQYELEEPSYGQCAEA